MSGIPKITNALTIDVEDYFQVSAFENSIRRDDWNSHPLRVVQNTERLLEILDSANVRATFYILGWVAEKCPDLVRAIQDGGHEIGTHSFWHRMIYQMTPDEFRQDLRQSIDVLQHLTGGPIKSFRAPSFSICARSLWSLNILADEGITIDSSIFPAVHDRYGIPGAPINPYTIETPNGSIAEFPPTVFPLLGVKIPVSGGGYFRFYPSAITAALLSKINARGRPFVFYLHPWEIDPGQPRLNAASRFYRWRHYLNLEKTENRLQQLINRFRFAPLNEIISSAIEIDSKTMRVNQSKHQLV